MATRSRASMLAIVVLGFHRDLLTATAYGVNEFLFVYGDRPETGTRSDDLTVRSMIAEPSFRSASRCQRRIPHRRNDRAAADSDLEARG